MPVESKMFSYTSTIVVALLLAAVAAQQQVRANSKFSQQFQSPQGRVFQPILLRPLGGPLVLLEQLQSVPQAVNNPPQPQSDVPEVTAKDDDRNITTTARNSTDSEPEPVSERSEKLTKKEDEGVYYIYHPNGLLQKVVYATNDDVEKMAFSARLKYENVEPIKDPIYTYDPETFVFKRV